MAAALSSEHSFLIIPLTHGVLLLLHAACFSSPNSVSFVREFTVHDLAECNMNVVLIVPFCQ